VSAQIVEPRVLRLSWCPTGDDAGARVADWVARLKKRLRVFRRDLQGRELVLQDVNAAGTDRAEIREGAWTDFIALYTVDYCLLCDEQGDASDLHEALLRRDEPGHQLWLVRLEPGDPADAMVGDITPWAGAGGWLVLPAPHPEAPLSTQPHQIDGELHAKCVEPLRARSPAIPPGRGDDDDNNA
jgi:hypothetical protein